MKLVPKIILHLIILLIVTILPVIVYTIMEDHRYYHFTFIGGITYFIYAFYLILKIKNHRIKVIFSGILSSLLVLLIGISLTDINLYAFLIFLVINIILQIFLLMKHPKSVNHTIWKSYLISFVVTLLLSAFFTFFWFLMLGASGLPSNHY